MPFVDLRRHTQIVAIDRGTANGALQRAGLWARGCWLDDLTELGSSERAAVGLGEEDRRCGGPSRVFRRLSELAAGLGAVAAGSGAGGLGRGGDQWGGGGGRGRRFRGRGWWVADRLGWRGGRVFAGP